MPADRRREIRERLFGAVDAVEPSAATSRSESGATVSTAPPGTRVPVRPSPPRGGSPAKAAAGLVLVGGLVALGWSWLAQDEPETASTAVTVARSPSEVETTLPDTTTPPAERTGVDRVSSVVVPPSPLALDDVAVSSPPAGSAAALLRGPDGATVWMLDVDGAPTDPGGLEVRRFGEVEIGVAPDAAEATTPSYRVITPCGTVLLTDGPGRALDRPEVVQLLESMSVVDGTVDISSVPGWSVIDSGPSADLYSAVFRVPIEGGATVPVRVEQVPGGAIAQMAFGGRQLEPTTFLGRSAHLDTTAAESGVTRVLWRDGATAFAVSSGDADIDALAEFVDTLEPATPTAWTERFGASASDPGGSAEPASSDAGDACTPQPRLGPGLDP